MSLQYTCTIYICILKDACTSKDAHFPSNMRLYIEGREESLLTKKERKILRQSRVQSTVKFSHSHTIKGE